MSRGTHLDLEVLSDYAGGHLAPTVGDEVRAHLSECDDCRARLAAVRQTADGSALLPTPDRGPPARDPEPGDMLGEYVVGEVLGRGGMGLVFRGRQPVLRRDVAIKLVLREHAGNREALRRVVQEARAVNAVRHPNIVDILSLGQLPDGRPYLVMPLLEGVSLGRLLRRRGRLSVVETLDVLTQALAGLAAAHAAGVIHRDLKPDNIFVDSTTNPWKITLLDFGIALQLEGQQTRLTQAGIVLGTPSFMSPEQFRGRPEDATDRLDVYSMGMVAWSLLVGESPFGEGPAADVMMRHMTEAVPPPGSRAPEVPPGLDALVLQMVEKDPQQRPTAAQALTAARALMRGLPVEGLIPKPPRRTRRIGPPAIALAAAFCVAIGATAGVLLEQQPHQAPAVKAGPESQGVRDPVSPTSVVLTPVAEPAPAALGADAGGLGSTPAPDLALHLPCRSVINVSDVETAVVGQWVLFQIQVDGSPALGVLAQDERGQGAKALRRLRQVVLSCRATRREIRVERPQSSGIWFTKRGTVLPAGLKARVEDLSIVDGPRSSTARSFRCDRLREVGAIEAAATEPSTAFLVRVEGEPALLISTPASGKGTAGLQRLRDAVAACRGTGKRLETAETSQFAGWTSKRGTVVAGGLRAGLADVSILAAEPTR